MILILLLLKSFTLMKQLDAKSYGDRGAIPVPILLDGGFYGKTT